MSSAALRDEPACMDSAKEVPSSLRRGHSFCRQCVVQKPEMQEGSECKTQSYILTEKKTTLCGLHCFPCAQPEEEMLSIDCKYCTQSPVPAIRTCLHCKASLCKDHLRVHMKAIEHFLSNSRRCSVPNKKLKYYCVDDDAYLCAHCFTHLHAEHQVESLDETSKEKNDLKNPLSSKAEAEDRAQGLKKQNRPLQLEADGLSKMVNVMFWDMRKHMEVLKEKVLNVISRQAVQVSAPWHDEIQELEAKKDESSGKMSTNEELCATSAPVTVLGGSKGEDVCGGNHQETNGEIRQAAGVLDEGLVRGNLHAGIAHLVTIAFRDLYKYEEKDISLDEDTAGSDIRLLPDMKSFYWKEDHKPKSKTPQRFRDHQVLSRLSFSAGRHFWTVETSKCGNWRLGMSYPSIPRKGFRSYVGCNKKSWGLCKWNNQYSVMHAYKEIKLPVQTTCHCFGVYLDYEAGYLAFYELSDPIRHLYTFATIFTEPLHPIFRLWLDGQGLAWIMLNRDPTK